jgi:hypothetical protein
MTTVSPIPLPISGPEAQPTLVADPPPRAEDSAPPPLRDEQTGVKASESSSDIWNAVREGFDITDPPQNPPLGSSTQSSNPYYSPIKTRSPSQQQEYNHQIQLHQQYERNLRILELQMAQHGGHALTPLPILNQIDATKQKLVEIERELEVVESVVPHAATEDQSVVTQHPPTVTAQEVLELSFHIYGSAPDPNIEQATIRALAAILAIPPEQIVVRKTRRGSIIFTLSLPKDAADRLHELYTARNPIIESIGLYQLQVIQEEDPQVPPEHQQSDERLLRSLLEQEPDI